MYYVIGASVPSKHRKSTDSLIHVPEHPPRLPGPLLAQNMKQEGSLVPSDIPVI